MDFRTIMNRIGIDIGQPIPCLDVFDEKICELQELKRASAAEEDFLAAAQYKEQIKVLKTKRDAAQESGCTFGREAFMDAYAIPKASKGCSTLGWIRRSGACVGGRDTDGWQCLEFIFNRCWVTTMPTSSSPCRDKGRPPC